MRCTPDERAAWQAFARARELTTSELARIVLNNVSGHARPPELGAFTTVDLRRFDAMTSVERSSRAQRLARRVTETELGIAATLVLCHCCMHLHHLDPIRSMGF